MRAHSRRLRLPPLALATVLAGVARAAPPPDVHPAATLEVWNRPVAVLRATLGSRTPAERAAYLADRIGSLPPDASGTVDEPRRTG